MIIDDCQISGVRCSFYRNFGIGLKTLEEKEKKSLNSFLGRFGVKSDDINKISSHYGSNALRIVKRNPYVLCEDRFLTFKVCDKIGKDLGFAPDSEPRLKCAMNYVLYTKAGAKGQVYLENEMLLEETNAFFRDSAYIDTSFSAEQLEIKLHNLVANDEIICERGKYYHPERYKNELTVSETLRRRAKKGSRFADISFDLLMNCVTRAEEENGIKLDDLQREAVMMAVVNSTVVITGGPGSGKTTLLNTFIKTVELWILQVQLMQGISFKDKSHRLFDHSRALQTANKSWLNCRCNKAQA